ncbi:MAG: GSCFA domain-containing protein [Ginsengibacter sp.]
MNFFLPFTIPPSPFKISYDSKVLLIGSCFSREIGDRMASSKFNVVQNPNGILYNPASIESAISSYIANKIYKEDELIEADGIYHSFQHHSSFSGLRKTEILDRINNSQKNVHHFLKNADVLIITFGTAYCYQWGESGDIVANCHKFPGQNFQKIFLEISTIENDYLKLIDDLKAFNPALKIVFTISPVKHIRDGVVENSQSKARLIESVHHIITNSQNTFYFPAYELVTDVLRDYRFFKPDLVHPNATATDFVFQKFCESFLEPETVSLQKEVSAIMEMVNHRPLFRESISHRRLIASLIIKIERLESLFPWIDFSKEKLLLID